MPLELPKPPRDFSHFGRSLTALPGGATKSLAAVVLVRRNGRGFSLAELLQAQLPPGWICSEPIEGNQRTPNHYGPQERSHRIPPGDGRRAVALVGAAVPPERFVARLQQLLEPLRRAGQFGNDVDALLGWGARLGVPWRDAVEAATHCLQWVENDIGALSFRYRLRKTSVRLVPGGSRYPASLYPGYFLDHLRRSWHRPRVLAALACPRTGGDAEFLAGALQSATPLGSQLWAVDSRLILGDLPWEEAASASELIHSLSEGALAASGSAAPLGAFFASPGSVGADDAVRAAFHALGESREVRGRHPHLLRKLPSAGTPDRGLPQWLAELLRRGERPS